MSYTLKVGSLGSIAQYDAQASSFTVVPTGRVKLNEVKDVFETIGCMVDYSEADKSIVIDASAIDGMAATNALLESQLNSALNQVSALQLQVSSVTDSLNSANADINSYLVSLCGAVELLHINSIVENASTYTLSYDIFGGMSASAHVSKTYDLDAQRLFAGKSYAVFINSAQLIDELGALRYLVYHY